MTQRPITRVDIPAKNREESAKFYHELFGWTIRQAGPSMNHLLFESGSIGGGFPQIDGKLYQGDDLLIYVQSDDVDADLKRAESLGAKRLTGRQEIPGVGQYAIFEEPSGNRIALWKPLRPAGG